MGNICRSPLAHAVFEDILKREKIDDRFLVDSSGTIDYHIGEKSDPRMRRTAKSHGIAMDHRAQQLTRNHLREFDLVICMDQENKNHALMLADTATDVKKICLLRDFDPMGKGNVPDPYFGGDKGFETVFDIVSRSCKALFLKLNQHPKGRAWPS
jgi:protein-tyrosine phosphatase